MRKSFFSATCALLTGLLFGSVATSAQAAPDSPSNIKALDQLIASSRDGKTARQDDLILSVPRLRAYRAKLKGDRSVRGAFYRTTYWTNGRVPYVFDATLDTEQKTWFVDAAREWEKYANLKFFPRTTEANYVKVFWDGTTTGSAYSNIGMQGGEQQVMLGKGVGKWVTVHELGHTLGMMHEQSRSDRDKFITVHFENVAPGLESQYAIVSDSDNHRDYDFDSIMHYFDTAFSVDGVKKTMIVKPGFEQFQSKMGQQDHTSERDKAAMADIYGFPENAKPTPTPTLPPRPTIVADDLAIKEGNSGTSTMTFRVMLSSLPTKDVTFAYKIVRDRPAGVSDENLDKFSANPGEDYSAQPSEGSFTLPAATTDNNGNSTKEVDINVSINGDTKVENDEAILLVLSDPINARFANESTTVSIKGTILNDDFDPTATATPVPLPTVTPVPTGMPEPTRTPKPTATPRPVPTTTPVPAPVARVTLSPASPGKTSTVVAQVVLTPSNGTTATLVWRLNGAVVARNVYSLNLLGVRGAKRGDPITVEVTPSRGSVKGAAVTARVEIGNTAPTANGASGTTRSAVPISIPLSGSDPDGDALSFALSTRPRNGTATVIREGSRWVLRYTSKMGFIGTESMSVIALDASAKSLAATVQVKVDANTSPQLVSVTPTDGSFKTATTVSFTQKVSDAEKNISTVEFVIGNSAITAGTRDGVSLVYDATTRAIQMRGDDGETLSEPVTIGGTLESEHAKAILRGVSTEASGALTLRWQITFKPGFTGQKTLWSRVEDAGTLFTGFRSMGTVKLFDSGSGSTTNSSAGNS